MARPTDCADPDRRRSAELRHRRRAAFRFGLSAETRVAVLLTLQGFRIVARRWRGPIGEIDIVVRRGRLLVFVEVKARDLLDDAAEAVGPEQQRRIVRAAEAWLASHPQDREREIRFDVVLVAPRRWPRHLRGVRCERSGLSIISERWPPAFGKNDAISTTLSRYSWASPRIPA
jgi:putative endonuclease